MRVLVVEDDERLAGTVVRGLADGGLTADSVSDAGAALAAVATTDFDVLVLDVMLPGGRDGFSLCRELRRRRVATPVLMLTARDAVADRVAGLESGADDYLVKPFALAELLARIRALSRRHIENRTARIEYGELVLDVSAREVRVGERVLALTAKELAVIELFMHNPGRTLPKEFIYDHVWSYEVVSDSNLVEVYVGRVRRKLDAAGATGLVTTLRGEGYRFDPPVAARA
jgi:DNA-binding response OmpR family regulator